MRPFAQKTPSRLRLGKRRGKGGPCAEAAKALTSQFRGNADTDRRQAAWSFGSSGRWRSSRTDDAVELGGQKQRALLAVLLLTRTRSSPRIG